MTSLTSTNSRLEIYHYGTQGDKAKRLEHASTREVCRNVNIRRHIDDEDRLQIRMWCLRSETQSSTIVSLVPFVSWNSRRCHSGTNLQVAACQAHPPTSSPRRRMSPFRWSGRAENGHIFGNKVSSHCRRPEVLAVTCQLRGEDITIVGWIAEARMSWLFRVWGRRNEIPLRSAKSNADIIFIL